MKVYVVTIGEYSDYEIAKIFLDKNKAEEFSNWIEESNGVDEWETADDDFELDNLQNKVIVSASYDPYDDEVRIYTTKYYNPYSFNRCSYYECVDKLHSSINISKVMPKDYSEEQVKKILYDKYAEVKALLAEGYTEHQVNEMINRKD